jgi:Arc/MetJ-type ribon-helix-helix transcriptional regulator
MAIQLAIQVDKCTAEEIDRLVPGRYANRTEVVRAALYGLLDREHRAEIGRWIVAGY